MMLCIGYTTHKKTYEKHIVTHENNLELRF